MTMIRNCVCGATFRIIPSQLTNNRGKYCSKVCAYANYVKPFKVPRVEVRCLCGKIFTTNVNRIEAGGGKYCGWACKVKAPVPEAQRLIQRQKMLGRNTGEDSPSWKGDDIGYFGLHSWVERVKGKPNKCEECLTTKARFEWANKSHEYRRDPDDWIRLCKKCHVLYDRSVGAWGATKRRFAWVR